MILCLMPKWTLDQFNVHFWGHLPSATAEAPANAKTRYRRSSRVPTIDTFSSNSKLVLMCMGLKAEVSHRKSTAGY